METGTRPTEVVPPPPKSRKEGWKPVEGDPGRVRYWDGKRWTDRYETAADSYRFLRLIFPQSTPSAGWFVGIIVALIFVLLIVAVWAGLIWNGGDDETPEPAGAAGPTAVASQTESGEPACPPGQEPAQGEFDAAPGLVNCVSVSQTGEIPATPPAGGATQEPGQPAGENPAACVAQTFTGGVDATFETAVGSTTQHASSQVVIAPDCTAKVEFVLLESGASDAYYSSKNPQGNFCAMVEGDGTLTFQPDGQGGGTLNGTVTVYPNVASSHHFDGLCPTPDRVGTYVLEGVGGEFSGSVTGSTLSGSGTFAHRQLPVGVSITATASG